MGDLLRSFSESVRVTTKHVEKTLVGLWGQSAILKAVWDVKFASIAFVEAYIYSNFPLLHHGIMYYYLESRRVIN
jgi:hypothetical protein